MQPIVDQIKDDILDGVLEPNSKLNISKLLKKYNIGLAPMREALALLAAKGLLIKEKNKGYKVPKISVQEAIEIYEASLHLEALAIKQSIKNFDNGLEDRIVSALYHLRKIETQPNKADYEEWSRANLNFHQSLISNCSGIVKKLLEEISLLADRYVRIAFSDVENDLNVFHNEHREIAEAVLDKNIDLSIKLLKSHSEKGMKKLIENLKGKFNEKS